MGPQEKSMVFDPVTGIFSPLSDITTPTQTEFVDSIGNFIQSRFPNTNYAAYVQLGYLNINPITGEPLSFNNTLRAEAYVGSTATGCDDIARGKSNVTIFLIDRLDKMQLYMAGTPPTSDDDDTGRVGIKIYDFRLGATRYRQYADIMPFAFIYLCTSPIKIAFSQPLTSYHMIAPRRFIN